MPPRRIAPTVTDAALDRWRSELLDLSKRNRLLYFQPLRHGLAIDHPTASHVFDGLVNKSRSYRIYNSNGEDVDEPFADTNQLPMVLDAGSKPVAPTRPPRQNEIVFAGDPKKVQSNLYRFRLRARSALIEQGVSVLYLAFGLLDWTESASSIESILSPLILVPVQLARETALSAYELAALDEGPMLNPSLVRKLETDFRLTLSLPESSDSDLDLNGMLDHVRSIVRMQRSWSVSAGASLGIFSFSKYAMYQDLEANRERFSAHPVLRMLAKDESAFDIVTPEMPTAEHLDRDVHPREMFQVLDADATQLEAIEAVKRGANLIIQGPPGTGKSQTITNIIAELLAQRKTVLFVSEKMAALQVVAKRLDEAGLQEFYLEAHSQDIKKAEIVKELDRAMMNVQVLKGVDTTVELDQIATMRRELNRYVDQLHDTNNPLGSSVYAAHGKLAALHNAPALHFSLDDIASLSKWRLVNTVEVVESLVRVGPVLFERDSHPWNGCILSSATPQVRSELESRLRHVAEAACDVKATQDKIRTALGLPEGHSLPDANWLLALEQLLSHRLNGPDHWIDTPSLDPVRTLVEISRDRAVTYLRRWNALRESYTDEFFALDLDTHISTLQRGAEPIASRIVGELGPPDRAIQQRDRLDAGLVLQPQLSAHAASDAHVSRRR